MTSGTVELPEIQAAAERIAERIRRTPIEPSPSLSRWTGHDVLLKLEHHQATGAFKLRGATNALLSLPPARRANGVACASTGNHGRALAHAASAEGVRCVVCMSSLVPKNKVDAIVALGAEARIVGRSQDEAQIEVDRMVREEGVADIPPFDHPAIIAGQGTIGLEIVDEVPEAANVLVPLSGGGLIAGVAAAIKQRRPDIRVVGVSMERGAAMHASLQAGEPVEVEELTTLADSLGGGIGLANRWTFAMVRRYVDDIVLLTEREIAEGIRHAYFEEREILEGAAAVGIGAILAHKVQVRGPTVVVLSGRNIAMSLHRRIIDGANQLEEAA